MNLKGKAQVWDATYNFPRPANEQYLSSYKAFLRLSKDGVTILFSLLLSIVSTIIAVYTLQYWFTTFKLSFLAGAGVLLVIFFFITIVSIWLMFMLDVYGVCLPYGLSFQRESHGGATWATIKDLQEEEIDGIRRADENIEGKGVILAPFKHFFATFGEPEAKYNVFLSLARLATGLIVWGPPGSGKSSTIFMPVIRQFASIGGAIILDVKGELFNYTAHYFSNVFRLDIMNPLFSDWFDLFGSCYRNPDLANRIAVYMVGLDPNKASSKDPIWDQSAVSMLAVMILYLCEKKEHPTPRDILRFLAENPKFSTRYNPEKDKDELYSPLSEAFEKCPYAFARDIWKANFEQMPKDTFGSVKFNADTAIKQLLSPKVNEILRPPTDSERRKGRRRIDFTQLRQMIAYDHNGKKRGTAIYIVVSPSDAMNMDVFLRVVFSVALDTLRESAKEGCRVLVGLDEAGNVPLSKLPEGINTDRSKGICYMLGYQEKNQPISQYGEKSANTFLGAVGVNVFLPGVADDTAEMASRRLGETTILQRSSSDASNDGFDSEKVSEAGRKLMMPQELTQMKWFTQCVITFKGAAPIRTKIPNDAKMQDTQLSHPARIVDHVSEEVLRMLGIKKGRETGGDLPVPQIQKMISPSLRNNTPANGFDRPSVSQPLQTDLSDERSPSHPAVQKGEQDNHDLSDVHSLNSSQAVDSSEPSEEPGLNLQSENNSSVPLSFDGDEDDDFMSSDQALLPFQEQETSVSQESIKRAFGADRRKGI